ncbi:MAG: hypothetical protein IPH50_14825 [Rhodanobacteraceae bacterium]|nr:hypothetical protein [Rhodanobacteraceae bacterium]
MLAAWSAIRGGFAQFRTLSRSIWGLILLAAVMLIQQLGRLHHRARLHHAGKCAVIDQAAPLLMSIGGILVFHERFNAWQWAGVVAVAVGLALFAFDQSRHSSVPQQQSDPVPRSCWSPPSSGRCTHWLKATVAAPRIRRGDDAHLCDLGPTADAIRVAGAITWPRHAHAGARLRLINTVAAYGAFAEALVRWEASRVGVVLAVTPLRTGSSVERAHRLNPALVLAETITTLGYVGAAVVVIGSAMASLSRK